MNNKLLAALVATFGFIACGDRPTDSTLPSGEAADDCLSELATISLPEGQEVRSIVTLLRFDDSDIQPNAWSEDRLGEAIRTITTSTGNLETYDAFKTEDQRLPALYQNRGVSALKFDAGTMPFEEVRDRICPLLTDGIALESVQVRMTAGRGVSTTVTIEN